MTPQASGFYASVRNVLKMLFKPFAHGGNVAQVQYEQTTTDLFQKSNRGPRLRLPVSIIRLHW
jgi:hypothetical protein